jgi:hypothetical protein
VHTTQPSHDQQVVNRYKVYLHHSPTLATSHLQSLLDDVKGRVHEASHQLCRDACHCITPRTTYSMVNAALLCRHLQATR